VPGLWAKLSVFSDLPGHTRLRAAVSHFFTPGAVEALRPRVSAIVDAVLAAFGHGPTTELMTELAYPIAVAVMAELFDVDADGAALLRQEAPAMRRLHDPIADQDTLEVGSAAAMRVMDFLAPIVAERRQRPANDLISALVPLEGDRGGLNADKVIVTCLLLVAAELETTADLIGNGAHALLNHREERDAFTYRPDLAPSFIDELVRYDSPVQVTSRVALADRKIFGHDVTAGQQVLVLLGAANRDPAYFRAPDQLDFSRSGPPPVGFGGGRHYCTGAPLARLVAEEALVRLFRRLPDLEQSEDGTSWRASTTVRGLEALPVKRGSSPKRRRGSGGGSSAGSLTPALERYARKSSELWDERIPPPLTESRGERTVATMGSFMIFVLLCAFVGFAIAALVIFPVVEMLKN
jgi:hypothetical protein